VWYLICAMVGLGCAMVGAVFGFFIYTLLSVAKQEDELGESTWLQD